MTRASLLNAELSRIDGTAPDNAAPIGKHQKMAANPFRFLRGAAQVFYADIANGLLVLPDAFDSVPLVRIMGDCHFSNFGFFTEEGSHSDKVIWAPNDFDDAMQGRAVWDITRYLVSLDLITDYLNGLVVGHYASEEGDFSGLKGIASKHLQKAKRQFLESYMDACAAMQADPQARHKALDRFGKSHFLAPFWQKAQKRAAGGNRFADKSTVGKLTTRGDNGNLVFINDETRFSTLSAPQKRSLETAFRPFLDDNILDMVARHGAGTGSVNVDRFYFLVGPAGDLDDKNLHLAHIVEVKQQRQAAGIHHFPDLAPENRMSAAHLTVDCQRRMMRRPDLVLDEVMWKKQYWLVRSRHHARVNVDPEDLLHADNPGRALRDYATACGTSLAQAHARSDRRSTRFETSILSALYNHQNDLLGASAEYARQVIADQTWLKDLLA